MENPFELLERRLSAIEKYLIKLDEKLCIKNAPEPPAERFIDTAEVAEILGVSSVSVWSYTKKGLLKTYYVGNLKRFKLSEVLSSPKLIQRTKK